MSMERTWTIDPAASTIHWSSTMVGVKTHKGTIHLTSGNLTTKGPTVTGGDFIVDLKLQTADMLDTNYAPDGSKQGTRANLIGHLMSPDFFAADSFPTATFKITSTTANTATGDLTVRGKTNPETVTDIVVTEEERRDQSQRQADLQPPEVRCGLEHRLEGHGAERRHRAERGTGRQGRPIERPAFW